MILTGHRLSPAVQVRDTLFVNQHYIVRERPLFAVCKPTLSGKPKAITGVPTYLYDRFHNGYLYRTYGGGSFNNSPGPVAGLYIYQGN
jgi:hypothetical protein